ncbi:forkhead box [Sparganum proliferum]
MKENVIENHAAAQPGHKLLMPLDSAPKVSSPQSHPEDETTRLTPGAALTEELSSLDWLQTEIFLPGTVRPTQKLAKHKPIAEIDCLQTTCSAGCVHSIDERINEDLHSLSWLQDGNLLPISPIDGEDDLPSNSAIQASPVEKVPVTAGNLAPGPVVTVPIENFGPTDPSISNGGPSPRLRVRLPFATSPAVSTACPTSTVLRQAKTIEGDNAPVFLSQRPTNFQRLLCHPDFVLKKMNNLSARSSSCLRRKANTEEEEQEEEEAGGSPSKRGRTNFSEKPIFTYAQLAFMAIESSQSKALEFSQIWEWCKNSFPTYNIGSRLKTCLRHILSSNASFQRVPQGQGRLSQWKIRPEMKEKLLHSLRFTAVDAGRTLSPDVERLLRRAEESFFTPERSKVANPLDLQSSFIISLTRQWSVERWFNPLRVLPIYSPSTNNGSPKSATSTSLPVVSPLVPRPKIYRCLS